MPGWLQSIVNFFGGGLSAIWHAFLSVINTVYNALHGDDSRIIAYAERIAAALNSLSHAFSDFATNFYEPFVYWTENTFAALQRQLNDDYNRLANTLNQLSRKTTQDITVIQSGVQSSLLALIKWILTAIWGPLSHDIAQALGWIAREGAYVFDLLTHLEKLADLIMAFLWSGWFALFRKFLKPIIAFIFAHWRSWLPGILPLLEDIISSVL